MRNNHATTTQEGGKVRILVDCTQCGTPHELTVPMENYVLWVNGELVQNAFPEIPREDRELLVTGTCGACFKKQFVRRTPNILHRIVNRLIPKRTPHF